MRSRKKQETYAIELVLDRRMENLRTRMKSPEYMEKAKKSSKNIGDLIRNGLKNTIGVNKY